MPTYYVRNDEVKNGLGYAIPDVSVTYYLQPGLTLASVFSGPSGGAASNPQITNGLGQTTAYLAAGQYTITYSGAQIQTLTLPDQNVGGTGSGSTVVLFEGIPQGTIDGTNRVFTLTNGGTPLTSPPSQIYPTLNGSLLQPSVGYTLSGVIITYTDAPQPAVGGSPADYIYVRGETIS